MRRPGAPAGCCECFSRDRGTWSSRPAFICAAIGSAVGFGNVWRFPQRMADFGGAAFLVPYLMALFFVGLPILFLEIGLGQVAQQADAGAFGAISKRLRGVGVSSVFCGAVVTSYYAMLIGWVCVQLVEAFKNHDDENGPWGIMYFITDVTGDHDFGEDSHTFTGDELVTNSVVALAFTWFCIFLCIFFGVKTTGRITFITMGLPVIFLIIFTILLAGEDGASDGHEFYFTEYDFDLLKEKPEAWSNAISQIFFSLSITFGIMTAYGSYNPRTGPAFTNSCIIAFSNSAYSLIAGVMVFSAVGIQAHHQGVPVEDVSYATLGLLFGTVPQVLEREFNEHWVRIFFLWLFLLGLDSAFSLIEATVALASDSRVFAGKPRGMVTGIICLGGFIVGLPYALNTGLWWLDTIDYYVNFIMLAVGFFEAFSAGWVYGIDAQVEQLGANATYFQMFGTFGTVLVACCVWFSDQEHVNYDADFDYNGMEVWGLLVLLGGYLITHLGTIALCWSKFQDGETPGQAKSLKEIMYWMFYGNVGILRSDLQAAVGFVPSLWAFLMRNFIPQVLMVAFGNDVRTKVDADTFKFGHYGGYPGGYQDAGMIIVALAFAMVILGAICPACFSCVVSNENLDSSSGKKAADEEGL